MQPSLMHLNMKYTAIEFAPQNTLEKYEDFRKWQKLQW